MAIFSNFSSASITQRFDSMDKNHKASISHLDEAINNINDTIMEIDGCLDKLDADIKSVDDSYKATKNWVSDNCGDLLYTRVIINWLYIRAAKSPFIRFLNNYFMWFTLSLQYYTDEELDLINSSIYYDNPPQEKTNKDCVEICPYEPLNLRHSTEVPSLYKLRRKKYRECFKGIMKIFKENISKEKAKNKKFKLNDLYFYVGRRNI